MGELMNIGLNLNNFNSSYGMSRIPVVRPEDVAAQDSNKKAQESGINSGSQSPAREIEQVISRAPKTANLEDVSLTFNKEDSFDNIGADADIRSLDMTKAISDMKRDSILSDYQTFVGPSTDQMLSNLEDGIVLLK